MAHGGQEISFGHGGLEGFVARQGQFFVFSLEIVGHVHDLLCNAFPFRDFFLQPGIGFG